MAKFEIRKTSDNEYRFNLKAGNGEVILTGETYNTLSGARDGIGTVMRNSGTDAMYERNESSDGQYYFTLKASNGRVIGHSERYTTRQGMEKGIRSVMKNAPEAQVMDMKKQEAHA